MQRGETVHAVQAVKNNAFLKSWSFDGAILRTVEVPRNPVLFPRDQNCLALSNAADVVPNADDVLANQKIRDKPENWERARFLARLSSFTSSLLGDGRAGTPAVSDKEGANKTFQVVPTNLQS
ncbi:hypothetical protein Pmani_005512 [Petrolisthes manimaculis]|uniref:Uncharacterized protein n=1 Tax=Petrolisthes manimaculis TaxID=1843537 RepID=A0AAE1UKH1_9EUCA|nr:hypothetical protein Pmani_005512 [Petrolisthes manimaculis]